MKLKPIGANQTELDFGDKVILFSYQTPVAAHIQWVGYFKTDKKWSNTTSKHINKWLASNSAREISQDKLDRFQDMDTLAIKNDLI